VGSSSIRYFLAGLLKGTEIVFDVGMGASTFCLVLVVVAKFLE
jgi:hypothetical protein